jgi:hypothetical protein
MSGGFFLNDDGFNIDTREFSKALQDYKAVSRRSLVDVLLRRMLFVIRRAMTKTPRADRAAMEAKFNLVATTIQRSKKTGEFRKKGNLYGTQRFFEGRAVKHLKEQGKGFTHQDVKRLAARAMSRSFSAIGSLQAGWLKPLRRFMAVAGLNLAQNQKFPAVKHPGAYKLPTAANLVAEVRYDLTTSRRGSKTKDIDPRVARALAESIQEETRQMQEETARRMQAAADKFNAR